jgi:hypothetical protein
MSEKLARSLLEHRRRARELGLGKEFRLAFEKIWDSLHTRPLPPDESADAFGEHRYTTPNPPRHRICIASVRPPTVYFAIYEDEASQPAEALTYVTLIRVIPMFE